MSWPTEALFDLTFLKWRESWTMVSTRFLEPYPKPLKDFHSDHGKVPAKILVSELPSVYMFLSFNLSRKIVPGVLCSFSAISGLSLSCLRCSGVFLIDIYGGTI